MIQDISVLIPADEDGIGDVELCHDGVAIHAGHGFDVDADGARCKVQCKFNAKYVNTYHNILSQLIFLAQLAGLPNEYC